MKVKERAVKTSHTNPIQDWYDTYNSISNRSNKNVRKYENGMLIPLDEFLRYNTTNLYDLCDMAKESIDGSLLGEAA